MPLHFKGSNFISLVQSSAFCSCLRHCHLSLMPSIEALTGGSAAFHMPITISGPTVGCIVKAGMVREWVAGKTV